MERGKQLMWTVLAISATVLTSFLPIFNKQLLRDARPALVAWATSASSLPLLAAGTFFLTQGTIQGPLGRAQLPGRLVWRAMN